MNGLQGRMLRMLPKKRRREILFVPGHHTSLERVFGLAEALNQYGAVTIPDLPGFGGMEPFYKLGEKATIDNYADYLASFIKLRFHRRRLTIMGFSFGFTVVTRMLQKHPDLVNRVDMVVSLVGVVSHEDFRFKRSTFYLFRSTSRLFSHRLPAAAVKYLLLRAPIIEACYRLVETRHSKLKDAEAEERNRRIAFEVKLWKDNDFRTWMETSHHMLRINLCNQQVALPIYHVDVKNDRYFDHHIVEQHLNVIYSSVTPMTSTMPNHAPSITSTKKEALPFFPPKLRRILSQS